MSSNIPAYLSTSRKVLNIQLSMAFSAQTYHTYQVIGMAFSWIFITLQAISIMIVKDKSGNKNGSKFSYDEMTKITSDDIEVK